MNPVELYETFWKPLLEKDGMLDKEQLKKELFDYHTLFMKLPEIFDVATGGYCSKPNTDLDVVKGLIEDYWDRVYEHGYQDALESYNSSKGENNEV